MADELQRVGLVFKADGAVDFQKSLKEINSSVQENRSSFKLAQSQWDDNTKSVDKLKDRQKYLADQTKDYSDKVKILKGELKELEEAENRDEQAISKKRNQLNTAETSLNNYKKGLEEVNEELANGKALLKEYGENLQETGDKISGVGKKMTIGLTTPLVGLGAAGVKAAMELDEGYDTIIAKTGATGDALQGLNDVADEVFGSLPYDMSDVGAAVGEINTRLGMTGDELEDVTEKFLKFADINETDVNSSIQLVTRAMGDAGIPASETGQMLDKLTIAAQASGIGIDKLTENITKYGAPMRALGLDTNESIAIFAGWEKAGVNTEIAFSGMKKAIGVWGKEGKDARVEFGKTLDAIKSAPDIASATSMAIEAFGTKAGPDLADAIQGGRFEYQEFLDLVGSSAGIVNQTWEEQQDPWDQAKTAVNNLKLAGSELGSTLLETLAPILERVAELVKQFSEWFRGLDDDQKKTIVTIGMVVAAIGPLLVVFGTVISSIGKITEGLGTIGGGIAGLGKLIIGHPILAAIVGIIAVIVLLYTKCEWFRDGVNDIFDGVAKFAKDTVEKVQEVWGKVKEFGEKAQKAVKDFLSFDWVPKIKLPHFKLSGKLSLTPPSVPSLSVKWYAKGGILNSPTIFGQGADGNLLGGGEAGKEAVLPIDLLRKYIAEENAKSNVTLVELIKEAFEGIVIYNDNSVSIGDRKFYNLVAETVTKIIDRKEMDKFGLRGKWA